MFTDRNIKKKDQKQQKNPPKKKRSSNPTHTGDLLLAVPL